MAILLETRIDDMRRVAERLEHFDSLRLEDLTHVRLALTSASRFLDINDPAHVLLLLLLVRIFHCQWKRLKMRRFVMWPLACWPIPNAELESRSLVPFVRILFTVGLTLCKSLDVPA